MKTKIEKKWRAEKGGNYWGMNKELEPVKYVDTYSAWHTAQYDHKNYFQTQELCNQRIKSNK